MPTTRCRHWVATSEPSARAQVVPNSETLPRQPEGHQIVCDLKTCEACSQS